jgi:hypothetical protein
MKKIFFYSFILSMSLGILSPLILISNNPSDFDSVNGGDFLRQLFLYFFCVFLFFGLVFLFIKKLFFKAEPFIFAIVCMILVWSFYLPLSVGKLDGVDVISISYLYLFMGLVFGFLGYVFEKKYFIFIFVLLSGPIYEATVSMATNISFESKSTSDVLHVSSKEKNILVISFDAIEARHMSNLIEANKDFKTIFNGFINFKNVSAVAPFTHLSTILTKLGQIPDVNSNEELLKKSDKFITTTFANNKYDVETYSYFNTGESALTNTVKQFAFAELIGRNDYELALEASLVRVFPYPSQLSMFFSYLNANQASKLESLIRKDPHPLSYYKTDIIHYDSFVAGLDVADIGPTFRMHHYVFTHDPITFDEFCEYRISTTVPQKESVLQETSCAIKKIGELISKLKEMGVYDNSLIIFTSDHGYESAYSSAFEIGHHPVSQRWSLSRYMPVLFVKGFDSKNGYVEDARNVSLLDIAKTLCMASFNSGLCGTYEGADLLSNSHVDSPNERPILVSKGPEDVRNYSDFDRVDISRDTSLASFFGQSTNVLTFPGAKLFGQVGYIDQGSRRATSENGKGYLTYGPYLKLVKGRYAARITYKYNNQNEGKKHALSTWDVTSSKGEVSLYKDNLVDSSDKVLTSEYIFSIDRSLSGVEIRSYFSGEGELEVRSVEVEQLGFVKELDDKAVSEIWFNRVNQPILSKGLGSIEAWGSWSVAPEVELSGYFAAASSLKLQVRGFVHSKKETQHADVLLNSLKIGEIIINDGDQSPRTFIFKIPPDLITFGEISTLKFIIKDPASPKSYGFSADSRLLGIGFESMVFQ